LDSSGAYSGVLCAQLFRDEKASAIAPIHACPYLVYTLGVGFIPALFRGHNTYFS